MRRINQLLTILILLVFASAGWFLIVRTILMRQGGYPTISQTPDFRRVQALAEFEPIPTPPPLLEIDPERTDRSDQGDTISLKLTSNIPEGHQFAGGEVFTVRVLASPKYRGQPNNMLHLESIRFPIRYNNTYLRLKTLPAGSGVRLDDTDPSEDCIFYETAEPTTFTITNIDSFNSFYFHRKFPRSNPRYTDPAKGIQLQPNTCIGEIKFQVIRKEQIDPALLSSPFIDADVMIPNVAREIGLDGRGPEGTNPDGTLIGNIDLNEHYEWKISNGQVLGTFALGHHLIPPQGVNPTSNVPPTGSLTIVPSTAQTPTPIFLTCNQCDLDLDNYVEHTAPTRDDLDFVIACLGQSATVPPCNRADLNNSQQIINSGDVTAFVSACTSVYVNNQTCSAPTNTPTYTRTPTPTDTPTVTPTPIFLTCNQCDLDLDNYVEHTAPTSDDSDFVISCFSQPGDVPPCNRADFNASGAVTAIDRQIFTLACTNVYRNNQTCSVPTNTSTNTPTTTPTPTSQVTDFNCSFGEPNETSSTATVIAASGTQYNAGICTGGDADWYEFSVGSNRNVEVHLDNITDNLDMYLYNATGNILAFSSNQFNEPELIQYTVPSTYTGVLRLRIYGVGPLGQASTTITSNYSLVMFPLAPLRQASSKFNTRLVQAAGSPTPTPYYIDMPPQNAQWPLLWLDRAGEHTYTIPIDYDLQHVDNTFPDLTVVSMELYSDPSVDTCTIELQTKIKNIGQTTSLPFSVMGNTQTYRVLTGLAPGREMTLRFSDYRHGTFMDPNIVRVDNNDEVAELREDNNILQRYLFLGSITRPECQSITPPANTTPGAGTEPPGSGTGVPLDMTKVNVKLTVKLQGVRSETFSQKYSHIKFGVAVGAEGKETTDFVKSDFTHKGDGVYEGVVTFDPTKVPRGNTYKLLVKGPKHLAKRFCTADASGSDYFCAENAGTISLTAGLRTFDFSTVPMAPGDLPLDGQQDEVVDSSDLTYIRQNLGKKEASLLKIGDLNLDGIIDTQDFSLVINNLINNEDER